MKNKNEEKTGIKNEESALRMLPSGLALLKESINIFKERFALLMSLTLLPLISALIGSSLIAFLIVSANLSGGVIMGLTIAGIVAFIVIQIFAQIGIYEAILSENLISFSEALLRAKGKFISYFTTAFLYVVIILGGFLLLIIPGFIFLVWFMFALIIVVAEGDSTFDALKKSKEYVRGYFGPVVLRWMFLMLAFILFLILVGIISEVIFGAESSAGESFAGALAAIVSPIGSAYLIRLYQVIKKEKEQQIT